MILTVQLSLILLQRKTCINNICSIVHFALFCFASIVHGFLDHSLYCFRSNASRSNCFRPRDRHPFERRLQSWESVNRLWLCFSPSKGSVYCYVSKLMTTSRSPVAHGGFLDWKHDSTILANHEKSEEHHQSVLSLARRSLEIGQVGHC